MAREHVSGTGGRPPRGHLLELRKPTGRAAGDASSGLPLVSEPGEWEPTLTVTNYLRSERYWWMPEFGTSNHRSQQRPPPPPTRERAHRTARLSSAPKKETPRRAYHPKATPPGSMHRRRIKRTAGGGAARKARPPTIAVSYHSDVDPATASVTRRPREPAIPDDRNATKAVVSADGA